MKLNAEIMMLIGGLLAFYMTVRWVRGREMREKYAVMWILVASLLLICGLFPRTIMIFADSSQLAYPSAVLFISLGVIYFFALSVTLSLSRQHLNVTRLLQEIALLKYEVEQLRNKQSPESATMNAEPPKP